MDGMISENSMDDTYPNIDSQNNDVVCLQPELTQQWQLEKQPLQMWSDSKTGLNSDLQLRTTNSLLQSKLESSEATMKYQQEFIMEQSLAIKRLEEKVAGLVHINNLHHMEKQMSAAAYTDTVATQQQPAYRYKHSYPTNHTMQHKQSHNLSHKSMKVKDDKDRVWISSMMETVDRCAKKYSVPFQRRQVVEASRKGKRPAIVPKVFSAIWKLYMAPTPDLVHVRDPRPKVDWAKLNPWAKKNLPKPEFYPVKGVSKDPKFYSYTTSNHMGVFSRHDAAFDKTAPFGALPGFLTDQGIVAVPEEPIHGYRWSQGGWVIATMDLEEKRREKKGIR